jgi:hypothetical protein
LSGKDAVMKISKIWVPDGAAPAGSLPKYEMDGIPTHHTIKGSNLALIRLSAEIPKILELSKL